MPCQTRELQPVHSIASQHRVSIVMSDRLLSNNFSAKQLITSEVATCSLFGKLHRASHRGMFRQLSRMPRSEFWVNAVAIDNGLVNLDER